MHNVIIGGVSALLYTLTGGLLALRLSREGSGLAAFKPALLTIAVAAIVLHSTLLYQAILVPQGMNLGLFNALSLAALLAALWLVVSSMVEPVENLGIALLPIAAVTIVLALLFPSEHVIPHTQRGLESHILLSIMAYSLLALAAAQAVLLAIQNRHLHNRQPGGFIKSLPPLVTMEALLFQMIGGGFALLSLALVSGFVFLDNIFAQQMVHKTVLSIAAWAVFGILLWGRWRYGWRGRTAIRWTLSGFTALVLAYFGSKVVLELILNR